MPWTARDAKRHCRAANTPHLRRLWAQAANNGLKEYGDDAQAIRVANAAVNKEKRHDKEKSTKLIHDLNAVENMF